VLVKTLNGCLDAEVRQELSRVACVFAENQIGRFQCFDRARRQIGKIADGCSDDEKFPGHAPESTAGFAARR